MIDLFFLKHREVVMWDSTRQYISSKCWDKAQYLLTKTEIPHPDTALIEGSKSIGDYAALYSMAVHQFLKKHYFHSNKTNDIFLKLSLLAKWLCELEAIENPDIEIARVAVGAMVQRECTLLLCNLRLNQFRRLRSFATSAKLDANIWNRNIAGAMAAAHTILTLCARKDARVFLPTVYEDAGQRIDLLWLEQNEYHAISIKCTSGQKVPIRAFPVLEHPTQNLEDADSKEKLAIYKGAHRFSKQYDGVSCHPVVVHVSGTQNLKQNWNEVTWPDFVRQQIKTHERTLFLTLAG